MSDYLDYIIGVLGALFSYFLGGLDGLIRALITLALVDYASGMAAAWIKNTLSSSIGFTGIARKVMMFALVGVAHIIDKELISKLLGSTEILRDGVLWFYLTNESLSILENAHEIGIPLPQMLIKHLLQIQSKIGNDEEDKTPTA